MTHHQSSALVQGLRRYKQQFEHRIGDALGMLFHLLEEGYPNNFLDTDELETQAFFQTLRPIRYEQTRL